MFGPGLWAGPHVREEDHGDRENRFERHEGPQGTSVLDLRPQAESGLPFRNLNSMGNPRFLLKESVRGDIDMDIENLQNMYIYI